MGCQCGRTDKKGQNIRLRKLRSSEEHTAVVQRDLRADAAMVHGPHGGAAKRAGGRHYNEACRAGLGARGSAWKLQRVADRMRSGGRWIRYRLLRWQRWPIPAECERRRYA